jgi:hypothetical protein
MMVAAGPAEGVVLARLENRAHHGHWVWPLLAITLSLATPLSLYISQAWFLFGDQFLFHDEYLAMLMSALIAVIIGLIAFVCGLKGLKAAKRQGNGILLATVALVISCPLFLLAILFFLIELGYDS